MSAADDDLTDDGAWRAAFGFDDSDDTWISRVRDVVSATDAPQRLGRYELLEEVSRGGQGVVSRARRDDHDDVIAVKRLLGGRDATPTARERFTRELEAVARLDHPGIVTVLGIESIDGQTVLAMEWIDGAPATTWAATVRGAPNGTDRILRAFVALCAAVHHAHQRGVIHRDLKPSNILIDDADQPHVLDFGLARMCDDDAPFAAALTRADHFLGTPAYAAPEQVLHPGGLSDVRTDVHALGVLLYEMLSGALPYADAGQAPHQVLHAIETQEPIHVNSRAPRLSREVAAIVMKAIARLPDARYPSVDAVRRDVERALDGLPVEARGRHWRYVTGRVIRRHRAPVALSLGAAALLVAFGIAMSVMYSTSRATARHAQRAQDFLDGTLRSTSVVVQDGELTLDDLISSAAMRIDDELGDVPEAEASVRLTLARSCATLGRWEDVATHAQRAAELFLSFGRRHELDRADALSLLASAHAYAGRPESVSIAREVLALRTAHVERDDPRVAAAHASLAFALWTGTRSRQFADEARAEYAAALAAYARHADDAPSGWARDTYSHARFLEFMDEPDAARTAYATALERFTADPARLDPFELRCRADYCALLERLGDDAGVERQLQRFAALCPPGLIDPAVARMAQIAARRAEARGDHAATIAAHRSALAMLISVRASRHDDADARALAARVRGGAPLPPDLDAIWRAACGNRSSAAHFELLEMLLPLAEALRRHGATDDAIALLDATLDHARRLAVVDSSALLALRQARVAALVDQGAITAARGELESIDAALAHVIGPIEAGRPVSPESAHALEAFLEHHDALWQRVRSAESS